MVWLSHKRNTVMYRWEFSFPYLVLRTRLIFRTVKMLYQVKVYLLVGATILKPKYLQIALKLLKHSHISTSRRLETFMTKDEIAHNKPTSPFVYNVFNSMHLSC